MRLVVAKHSYGTVLANDFHARQKYRLTCFHFSLQLCVNVQIPRPLRGQEAMALFIDTDHGFSVDRLKGMNAYI